MPAAGTAGPPLAIIMPTLNAAAQLERALASLATQGVECETIVVDGGSRDATAAIAEAAPDLAFIAAPGSSIYQALNLGLSRARAPLVAFLNADDMLMTGALRAALAGFERLPAAEILRGRPSFVELGAEGAFRPVREIDRRARRPLTLDLILRGPFAINSMVFRRTVFERLGAFDTRYRIAADRDWMLRAWLAGVVIAELDHEAYRYEVHPGSSTMDRARRHYAVIRREHLAIARERLVDPAPEREPASVRRAIRNWHALETAMLARHLLGSGELSATAAVLRDAFRAAPLWPAALVDAVVHGIIE